jgi:sugar phosphate permease
MKSKPLRYRAGNKIISFATAIITIIVGFLISAPFFWFVALSEQHSPYMTLSTFLMIIGFVIGSPMFLFGLVGLISRRGAGPASTIDLDISRIRYTVETDKMGRK